MAGAAGLVQQFREVGLTAGLQAICDADDHRKLTKALMKPAETGSGGALIGQDRARDLAVNVVLPFLQAADLKAADQQATDQQTTQPQVVDRLGGAVAPEALHEGRYWELYRGLRQAPGQRRDQRDRAFVAAARLAVGGQLGPPSTGLDTAAPSPGRGVLNQIPPGQPFRLDASVLNSRAGGFRLGGF